ncbi:hypothetical protein CDL15_Pgr022872 [Punica granatum]|uniref:Uncharacterized protein n=1 Tax=Punica granatum TaxID=22663 RepID=A0A218X459_PUNGR|nr:hypothetical protein CDL15_Pgr022872 [Punica granatum]PKI65760.1 hypothetical protein CRG98_013832 [Punica granatum]
MAMNKTTAAIFVLAVVVMPFVATGESTGQCLNDCMAMCLQSRSSADKKYCHDACEEYCIYGEANLSNTDDARPPVATVHRMNA